MIDDYFNNESIRRKITLAITNLDEHITFLECKEDMSDEYDINFTVSDEKTKPVENADVTLNKLV